MFTHLLHNNDGHYVRIRLTSNIFTLKSVSARKHQRNINDDQSNARAETGGVIGINGLGIFLGDNDGTNETILKHVCYLIEIVGPEHIGIGLDYSPEVDVNIGDILKKRPNYWPAGQQ